MKSFGKLLLAFALMLCPLAASAQLSTDSFDPQADSLTIRQMRTYLNGIRRSENRPTVALVLSGGGAKGAAHVGVLRYLEENDIPVDVVLGTSMGGLIGGLYSLGYKSHDIDSILVSVDWDVVLSDKVPQDYISYKTRKYRETYVAHLPFHYSKEDFERRLRGAEPDWNQPAPPANPGMSADERQSMNTIWKSLPAGYVSGLNVLNLFSSLAVGYQDDIPFTDLPIPYFCVASDLISCKAYNWMSGSIVDAMRSTMSIPGLFEPVRVNGRVLIDGGTRNNFPTDIARSMGADVIIGVELSDPDKTYTEINNLGDLLRPMIDMLGREAFSKNVDIPDIFIKPNLSGYNMLSFDAESVADIEERGYNAAMSVATKIADLQEKTKGHSTSLNNTKAIDIGQQYVQIRTVEFSGVTDAESLYLSKKIDLKVGEKVSKEEIEDAMAIIFATGSFNTVIYKLYGDQEPFRLVFECDKGPTHQFGLGIRADNEELVALAFNVGFGALKLKGPSLSLSGKIGQNNYLDAHFALNLQSMPTLNVTAKMLKNTTSLGYSDYDETGNLFKDDFRVGYWGHEEEIYLSDFRWSKGKFNIGVKNAKYAVNSLFTAEGTSFEPEVYEKLRGMYQSAFGDLRYDSYDDGYFPSKGANFGARYDQYFSKTLAESGFKPFSIVAFDAHKIIPLGQHLAFIPGVYGRGIFSDQWENFYVENYVGGSYAGRYFSQQIPFAGFETAVMTDHFVGVADLQLRAKFGQNFYTTAKFSVLEEFNVLQELLDNPQPDLYGAALEFAYKTPIGPLKFNVHWSSWYYKYGMYLSFGYDF